MPSPAMGEAAVMGTESWPALEEARQKVTVEAAAKPAEGNAGGSDPARGAPVQQVPPPSTSITASSKRVGALIRPTTPKSSVPTVSAFESIGDSDEDDDLAPDSKNDASYLATNEAIGANPLPDKASQNVDIKPVSSTNMIRSHSATGSLHGPQLNPVAADILRKEPKHETFSRINITAIETLCLDEIEACKVLQKCLELRERYIFREEVAPWEKEIITDPSTPKPNPNPFNYEHQTKTEVFKECHSYNQDGNSFELSLVTCKCIGAHVKNKKNQNQIEKKC